MEAGAVRFVLQTMGSLFEKEASLLGSLRRDFNDIKSDLESIQSVLEYADGRKDLNSIMRTWIKQLHDVTYDIQDLMDEFMYHIDRHENRGTFMGSLHTAISFPKSITVRHRIATRLQEIKAKVLQIMKKRKEFGIEVSRPSSNTADDKTWPSYAESSHFVVEDDIVGIEENRNKLIRWLKDEELQLKVLPVVGMGGLGKTTLVTKVLNSPDVKTHFHCYAWISVSQSYEIEALLRRMVKELHRSSKEDLLDDINQMDHTTLVRRLITYLQDKRYVIVLDDVWNRQAWDAVSVAIPKNEMGSRVMLTTRNNALKRLFDNVDFDLQPLGDIEAWTLFCKKAFRRNPNRNCPKELEEVAQKMVHKCQGLPLAIVAIGGLMSLKEPTEFEWKKVEDSLSSEISNNPDLERMKHILLLSYNDLPYHLKNCFLYASVFPEDCTIRKKKLIRLWIAEGFVEERRGKRMEDVAEEYLNELTDRSMLQVADVNDFKRTKSCRVHDLMHDLALSIAEEEKFCMVYDGKEAREDCEARRLSIQISRKDIPRSTSMSRLRSFFIFGSNIISSSSLKRISSTFQVLRVLDLQDASIQRVPDAVVNLFNLRYLSLRNTNVRKLPRSFGRLRNLQTLDIRDSKIKKLPGGLKNMKNLRNLLMYRYTIQDGFNYFSAMKVPTDICKLKCLQCLTSVEANEKIVRQLGNLTQLKELEITKVRKAYGEDLCSSIQKMEGLIYLHVMGISEKETLQLEELSCPPSLLQKILLTGHLNKVPHWIASLRNLTFLNLQWSQLQEDPLPSIGSLPNLVFLSLLRAYDGQQLCFQNGGFPKLQRLYLADLTYLKHIKIEKGAMPSIQEIDFFHCQEFKMLPEGIEHLCGLQELYLKEMPKEFVERLQQNASEDRKMVQHIPIIRNFVWREGMWVYENLS